MGQAVPASEATNAQAIDAALKGFTAASFHEAFCWWYYSCISADPAWRGRQGLRGLVDAIVPPASPNAPRLEPGKGTVFLLGTADEPETRDNFCHWAHGLANLQPADLLAAPGTLRRIGILRLPEVMFTAGRATDGDLSAFLAQLGNVTNCFDALYLLGDQTTSSELGAVMEIPPNDRPYLVAQLVLHLSMPEPNGAEMPSGICSAGSFALHASWEHYVHYCRWRLSADLWQKFLTAEKPPFFEPQKLRLALKDERFGRVTQADDWRAVFLAAIPKTPDLPSQLWNIPADDSPWRIWSSKLLDHGGFFERWLRDWVANIFRENQDMTRDVLENCARRLDEQENKYQQRAIVALRDELNSLGASTHSARSKAQFDVFFADARQHLKNQAQKAPGAAATLFDFESEPAVREMLDRARKDVEEQRDKLAEAAELRGMTVRLQGHPSLLAMSLRAVFASSLLVMLVPPALALLQTWRPESALLTLPPEGWAVLAFLGPIAAMLLSVKLRHNHIRQHARKLTALALARLEKRVGEECESRLRSAFERAAATVAGFHRGFAACCQQLSESLCSSPPPIARPELPVTAFQKPLLGGDGTNGLPEPTSGLLAPSSRGTAVAYDSLRDEDYNSMLCGLISAGVLLPASLAPELDQDAGAEVGGDPVGKIIEATLLFAENQLNYADEGHVGLWEDVAARTGRFQHEISLRSAPSVEKQQGHDIAGGRYDRCSSRLALSSFRADILHLDGYASWMAYNRFPNLASGIQNSQTVDKANAWLSHGLCQDSVVTEEFRAPVRGRLTIEREPWCAVKAGDLLAKVGSHEWRAKSEGFVVFQDGTDEGEVEEGMPIGRVVTFSDHDPRFVSLFRFVHAGAGELRTLRGGLAAGSRDRVETYKLMAMKTPEGEEQHP